MLIFDAAAISGALLVALLLDTLLGDPPRLYERLPHPVVLIGRAITRLEAHWLDPTAPAAAQKHHGIAASLGVVLVSSALGLVLQWLLLRLPWGWLVLGALMSSLIAWRGLHDHVAAVAAGLEQGLGEGRRAVAHIVGRDPRSLDHFAVARAAIESTAENFADGVVAPVFWAALLGLPGMLAYKTINTLDSMIGHRTPRYEHFGWFAARLDDLANWLPARLAAVLILVAGLLLPGARPGAGWRAMRHDAHRHRSANAGWPEAAMAGCLGLALAGPRRYGEEVVDDAWMGDGRAEATSADIRRALQLLAAGTLATAVLAGLPLAVILLVG